MKSGFKSHLKQNAGAQRKTNTCWGSTPSEHQESSHFTPYFFLSKGNSSQWADEVTEKALTRTLEYLQNQYLQLKV